MLREIAQSLRLLGFMAGTLASYVALGLLGIRLLA
jgi:hypothetical protein